MRKTRTMNRGNKDFILIHEKSCSKKRYQFKNSTFRKKAINKFTDPEISSTSMRLLAQRFRALTLRWQCRHHGGSALEQVPAEIVAVKDLTPSIKELRLRLEHDQNGQCFNFKAGNWVDFFIDQDGVSKVGGYSMSSIPSDLPELRLAVKASRHPPAQWCHTFAKSGKRVKLTAGGSFYFDAEEHGDLRHLTFIAGGIGINPIFSMLKEAYYHRQKLQRLERITLLYSASKPTELAYSAELLSLAKTWSEKLHLELRVTREQSGFNGAMEQLQQQLPKDKNGLLIYLCGPPAMTDQFAQDLKREGLDQALRYEKWWWTTPPMSNNIQPKGRARILQSMLYRAKTPLIWSDDIGWMFELANSEGPCSLSCLGTKTPRVKEALAEWAEKQGEANSDRDVSRWSVW